MELLSLYDYLGYPAGSRLGAEVAKYAKQQKSPIKTRQVSNSKYSGPVNLYNEGLLDAFFNNPNYREIIQEDKKRHKNKTEKSENELPF